MLKTKEILRLLASGTSQNSICAQVHCSKRSVSAVAKRLSDDGNSAAELLDLPDSEIERMFSDAKKSTVDEERKAELERLMPEVMKRLGQRHANMQFVYEHFYIPECPQGYGYTQFKKYIKEWKDRHNLSYHHTHQPGREWQIDFAGDPLWLTDRLTGNKTRLVVLVCVMPYSNLPFMMALPNASTEWFFPALNKGLEFMGALPAVAKSDNMKQWVSKSDRYDLSFSEASAEWATYYGIEPTACRVRRPRDKGAVEGAVKQLYNYVYARIETQEFHTLEQINSRIMELLMDYVELPYKGRSRWQIFEEEELPHMKPLPERMHRVRQRKEVKLSSTYHVCVGRERHFYSVPYTYVGQTVKVMWDVETVEVYADGQLLCVHPRSTVPYGYSTDKAHMPERHKAYERTSEVNAVSLIDWGRRIGPNVADAVESILERTTFPQQAYRNCTALLSLAKKYGHFRTDRACSMMMEQTGSATYRAVKAVLDNKRDLMEESGETLSVTPSNPDVRGAGAYKSISGKEVPNG